MIYFEGGEARSSPECLHDVPTIVFCSLEEMPEALKAVSITLPGGFINADQHGTRFESHRDFDSFTLHSQNLISPDLESYVGAVFNAMRLVVVYGGDTCVDEIVSDIKSGELPCEIPAVLQKLFDNAISYDEDLLESFEDNLLDMEERIIADELRDCVPEIIQMRRSLLLLNRYYDGLFRVLQGLEENRNGFMSKHSLNTFRLLSGRVDRLTSSIVNLREYAAQVREAYQNQLDIDLNKTMKLFTVITTIFLPLTLLAGWYGMNFNMPEYSLPWAYPVFIGLSAAVIVGLLVYFKRKKWF